jgi:hypothetical protein
MSHHFHVVLRIRPDLVEAWSADEIARRRLRLYPPRDETQLPLEHPRYLSPLDWTGRQLRAGKRVTIPEHLAPILDRLRINGDGWLETVRDNLSPPRVWRSATIEPVPLPAPRCRRGFA